MPVITRANGKTFLTCLNESEAKKCAFSDKTECGCCYEESGCFEKGSPFCYQNLKTGGGC